MTLNPDTGIIIVEFRIYFWDLDEGGVKLLLVTLDFKGNVMKQKILLALVTGILLAGFAVTLSGCAQPGKTAADVRREQIRTRRLNDRQMADDLEAVLNYDEPSKLSDLHIR